MATSSQISAKQLLWSQAVARFRRSGMNGSGNFELPQAMNPPAKRARTVLNTQMPKLEPMFVPSMPSKILPRVVPMLRPMQISSVGVPFTEHFAGILSSRTAPRTRKNAVCRNFGSVRCSKCNRFGLSGECCKAYYYVVIRSKKVPKDVQKQVAQTAFESFREAENFRIEIATKYKKMRHKRKRESRIATKKSTQCLSQDENLFPAAKQLQPQEEKPLVNDVPMCALSEQEQRIKIAAESLLGLDRRVVRPFSPGTRTSDDQSAPSKFSLTPPRRFEEAALVSRSCPEAKGVIVNHYKPAVNTIFQRLNPVTTMLQPPAKTCLKGGPLRSNQFLMPPYMHTRQSFIQYPCASYSSFLPQYPFPHAPFAMIRGGTQPVDMRYAPHRAIVY